MLELVVVMGIILILISLLIVGMKHWGATANKQTTVLRMEVLNGMLSDLQAVAGNQFNNEWFMNTPPPNPTGAPLAPQNLPLDMQQYGDMNPDVQGGVPQPLPLPVVKMTINQIVTPVGVNSRQQAIDDTSYGIMRLFAAIPSTNKGLQSLPTSALAPFIATPAPVPTPTSPNAGPPWGPIPMVPQPPQPPATVTYPPVVLDGWGNPIIFVPASGLYDIYTGLVYVNVTIVGTNHISFTGSLVSVNKPVTAPDGRPFWVSAGPDGNFVLGDDNIYSFSPN